MTLNENDLRERAINVEKLIRNHVLWSMGAGLIPIPIVDFFAVGGIQLDLVRQMCKLYDLKFKENDGKAIVSALTGSGVARLGAQAIKFIPGVGTVLGSVSMSVLSGASTYALGQVFKKHFETGGTILDFDSSRLKKMYDEQFEKGKKVARDMKRDQEAKEKAAAAAEIDPRPSESSPVPAQDTKQARAKEILDELKQLTDLKDSGAINQEEYDKIKKSLLAQLDG